jgi:carbonic anhydrase
MQKALILSMTLAVAASAQAEAASEKWGYSGDRGQEQWANLSPEYASCTGKNQSPIDLDGFIEAELPDIAFNYQPGGRKVLNNGHTVQVDYAPGSTIELDGTTFELKQFHFHAPSENHIQGESFPLEAHLVHASDEGALAVVAVMFEEGDEAAGLADAWNEMPEQAGDEHLLSEQASASALLPSDHDYYRFNGSLTTPPCTEGVRWLVMKQPLTASKEQIQRFAEALHEPNNRSLQPVGARPILK